MINQKITVLKFIVTGLAKSYMTNDPACIGTTTFEELTETLKTQFIKKLQKSYYVEQLGLVKQGKYESVWDFADRVKSINNKLIMITGSEPIDCFVKSEVDTRALHIFLSGLRGKVTD